VFSSLDHAGAIADALQLYPRTRIDRTVQISTNKHNRTLFHLRTLTKFAPRLRTGTKERIETRGSTRRILTRLS
jgi:hypothetical protein